MRSWGGLIDSTPASYTWRVDAILPETTITRHPPDPNRYTFARFEFSSSEAASFKCKLDEGSWEVCTSPRFVRVANGMK